MCKTCPRARSSTAKRAEPWLRAAMNVSRKRISPAPETATLPFAVLVSMASVVTSEEYHEWPKGATGSHPGGMRSISRRPDPIREIVAHPERALKGCGSPEEHTGV